GLPSFAELNSLKELRIVESSRKLKKIEGLEHCKSLETLRAETMWNVTAGIKSLEQMERLRRVELSACYISAIEPCLLTIKKWPSETIICARTERDMDSIVNSPANSPALLSFTVLDSCVKEENENDNFTIARLKCGQRHSSNAAAMVCFVINSLSYGIKLYLESSNDGYQTSRMRMEKGKWVWIGVFTHASWLMAAEHRLKVQFSQPVDVEVRGTLVMGEQERVVEGFYKLLVHLGK
ncbi:hypothetical protein KI387_033072, partial [Taxus chinensis]